MFAVFTGVHTLEGLMAVKKKGKKRKTKKKTARKTRRRR